MNKHPDSWLCDEPHDENTSNMMYDFICHTIEQAEAYVAESANCSIDDVIRVLGNVPADEWLRILYPELHRNIVTMVTLLGSGVLA